MKRVCLISFILFFSLFACKSEPEPVPEEKPQSVLPVEQPKQPVQDTPIPGPAKPQSTVFDPSSISQQERDKAKMEIQELIKQLNGIIRAKNYNSWVNYLDNDYFAAINSPEFLERVSKSPAMVRQKIILKTAQDYFYHVVVPSRTNDRVDDIEFISMNRVKAFIVNINKNGEEERLRLYDLEKTGTGWKIIN